MEEEKDLKCGLCGKVTDLEHAFVPAFAAIIQAIEMAGGKPRPLMATELANHVHCKECSGVANEVTNGAVKMHRYSNAVAELIRREAKKQEATAHFQKYVVKPAARPKDPERPKPQKPIERRPFNTSMRAAMSGALAGKSNGKAVSA